MNRGFAESLVKKASMDIQGAILVYKNGDFPNAVFLLQQAAEKGYKAGGLLSRLLVPGDLHGLGHNYLKMMIGTIKPLTENRNSEVDQALNMFFENGDYSSGGMQLEPKHRALFFDLSEEELKLMLGATDEYRVSLQKILSDPDGVKNLIQVGVQMGKLTEKEIEEAKNSNTSLSARDVSELTAVFSAVFEIQIVGLITTAHSEQSRYPFISKDQKSVLCPTDIYTEDMPLVQKLPELFLITAQALQNLQIGISLLM